MSRFSSLFINFAWCRMGSLTCGFVTFFNSELFSFYLRTPSSIQFVVYFFRKNKLSVCWVFIECPPYLLLSQLLSLSSLHPLRWSLTILVPTSLIQFSTQSIPLFTASNIIFICANYMLWFYLSLNPFLSTTRFSLTKICFLSFYFPESVFFHLDESRKQILPDVYFLACNKPLKICSSSISLTCHDYIINVWYKISFKKSHFSISIFKNAVFP